MSDVVRRRAGDDAIVIVRVALRLREALLAASGAAVPIGEFRGRAVKRLDDQLRIRSHFMHGAIRPIDEFFGMTHGPAFVIPGRVAGIGAGSGIAPLQGRFKRSVTNLADEAAIADGFELSVPARRRRKPHFKADMRIAGGRGKRNYAAKRLRDFKIASWPDRPGGNWDHQVRGRIDCGGGGHGRVGNLKRRQTVAGLLGGNPFR